MTGPPDRDFVHEALGDEDKGPFDPDAFDRDTVAPGTTGDPNDDVSDFPLIRDAGERPQANRAGDHTAELDVRDAGDDTEPPPPRRWLAANRYRPSTSATAATVRCGRCSSTSRGPCLSSSSLTTSTGPTRHRSSCSPLCCVESLLRLCSLQWRSAPGKPRNVLPSRWSEHTVQRR